VGKGFNGHPGGSGGAIATDGPLTITNSVFEDNLAGDGGNGGMGAANGDGGDGGAGGNGGAIGRGHSVGAAPVVTIVNSTFNGNEAGDGGDGGAPGAGGITTGFAGLGGHGGAIGGGSGNLFPWPLELHLLHDTIASNNAGQVGSGSVADPSWNGSGGGVAHNAANSGVQNTIIASNQSSLPGTDFDNCISNNALTDGGHNLAFPASTGCPASFASGDPMLGPLAGNGGPTATMALLEGSAAIDQVPSVGAGCEATDQRGISRPQGAACDIGAYEFNDRTLTLVKEGSGADDGFMFAQAQFGPITISCGPAPCTHAYPDGTEVQIGAYVGDGSSSRLVSVSGGGCSGTEGCTVTMDSDKTVTATFVKERTLSVSTFGSGAGKVTSQPGEIDCGSTCSTKVDDGTSVTLTASPAPGSSFAGWTGGGCSGTGKCTVTMDSDRDVAAAFVPSNEFTLGKPKLNKKRGTAKLPAVVPGAGVISLQGRAIKAVEVSAGDAGTVMLKVAAKGKAKRKLAEAGKAKVKVEATYTPTGGDPASARAKVKLVRKAS
jgi:hypothetical protein